MNPNAMLSKQHTEAIKSASTEADKVKRLGEDGARPHRMRFKALK